MSLPSETSIMLVVEPALKPLRKRRQGETPFKAGRYNVRLGDEKGEIIAEYVVAPFLAGLRELARRGHPIGTIVAFRHAGSTTVSMCEPIRWGVSSPPGVAQKDYP